MRRAAASLAACGVIFLLLVVLCYRAGLSGPPLLDDGPVVEPLLVDGRLAADWRTQILSTTGPLGRPLAMLSFAANAAVNGGDFFWWKLTNLALHLATGGALWWLASGLLAALERGRPERPAFAALVIAGLWLLHPLAVSTVLYTVQRMTVLAALFAALGMGCYVAGRRAILEGRPGAAWIAAAYALFLPLAALSKESGLLLPCYLAVIEFTVFAGRGTPATRRGLILLHGLMLGLPAVFAIGYYATHADGALLRAYADRGMSLHGRLLSEARVMVRYLAQIVIPDRRALGFFHDDIALSTGLFSPPTTVWSLALLAVLLGTGFALRRRLPLVAAGILFFFAGHLMESTIFPLELMFEHRNYLPSFGVLLAIAGLVLALGPAYARFDAFAAAAATVLLALLTGAESAMWSRLEILVPSCYARHPQSESAAANFAELLSNSGHGDLALKVLSPIHSTGARLHERYVLCKRDGRLEPGALAPALLDAEPTLRTYAVTGLIELAKLGLDDACEFDRPAFRALLAAAVAKPIAFGAQRFKLRIYEAHLAWKSGDREVALKLLDKAQFDSWDDPTPAMLATEWLIAMGDLDRAGAMLSDAKRRALAMRADFRGMIANLETELRRRVSR